MREYSDQVKSQIQRYNQKEVIAWLAALQLIPENSTKIVTLESILHPAVAAPPSTENRPLNQHKIIRIIEKLESNNPYKHLEDPNVNLFTEEVSFFGGPYVVFPGVDDQVVYTCSNLSRAIFLLDNRFHGTRFGQTAFKYFSFVLELSNQIATRMGYERGLRGREGRSRNVHIPREPLSHTAKASVTFTSNEMNAIISKVGISINDIKDFITIAGNNLADNYRNPFGKLLISPIVSFSDGSFVVCPTSLLCALKIAILDAATNLGLNQDLASAYHEAIWGSVNQSLSINFSQQIASSPLPIGTEKFASFQVYSLDSDKITLALLVTDPLDGFNRTNPESPGDDFKRLFSIAAQSIPSILEGYFHKHQGVNDVLVLLILQGIGRSGHFSMRSAEMPIFPLTIMHACDLDVISRAERGSKTTLYYYAESERTFKEKVRVLSFSALDTYELYRSHNHSFYLSDNQVPSAVNISCDMARDLIWDAYYKTDPHSVLSPLGNAYIEAWLFHGEKDIPIYLAPTLLGTITALYVEGYGIPVWVMGPLKGEDPVSPDTAWLYAPIVSSVAYWLWQLTPSLRPLLRNSSRPQLNVHIELPPHENWTDYSSVYSPMFETALDQDSVRVTIHNSFLAACNSADNKAERDLMREILFSLQTLLGPAFNSEVINALIERYIPLGNKKMIVLISPENTDPEINDDGLRPFRKVQEALSSNILDDVGEYLKNQAKIPVGPIPRDHQPRIINQVVGHLFNNLEALIQSHRHADLLQFLLDSNERCVVESAKLSLETPFQMACFSDEPSMVDILVKRTQDRTRSSLALRFAIEYLAACPSSGIRPVSTTSTDQIIALADKIINFGFQSDLIQFDLVKLDMAVLESGRLGTDRVILERAMDSYMRAFTRYQFAHDVGTVARYWRGHTEEEKPSLAEDLDAACIEEFGFSMTEILDFIANAVELGISSGGSAYRSKRDRFIDEMVFKSGNTKIRIDDILSTLTICTRPSFLKPSPPYTGYDVYPWRFNRGLSLLRKPFIETGSKEDPEITFGPRSVYNAGAYLLNLCLSGRLDAKSQRMKEFISKMLNLAGEDFNDKVADRFAQKNEAVVLRRFEKVRGPDGTSFSPGDIDVLVLDKHKKAIIVVETKEFFHAKTPYEMAQEIKKIYQGGSGKKSSIEKHSARIEWVKTHHKPILQQVLGLSEEGWQIESLYVVSSEMATSYLRERPPLPIMSYNQLKDLLASDDWHKNAFV